MIQEFKKINKVQGELKLPGDKSISHRAILFSAMADGESRIINLSGAGDLNSTQECCRDLGVKFIYDKNDLVVSGKGIKNFTAPIKPLFAGNSGTTARLITGLLACQDFKSIITGDSSLSKRPMQRIIDPLKEFGAELISSENNTLPLTISPSNNLKAINYTLPVASAQVKSGVLIAGLHLDEVTSVTEKNPSRNHTEKMLGLRVEKSKQGIVSYSSKSNYPKPKEYFIPSDVSTAAFFIVLTLLSKNSFLTLRNVTLNESRTGYLEILKKMGASIEIENKEEKAGEEFGDLVVKSSKLSNIKIPGNLIPNIIDEIPILAVAGIFADGEFEISNASELRTKESDRIKTICENLRLLDLTVDEKDDGFSIKGDIKNIKVEFQCNDDHRIAMAFSVLSMLLENGGKVNGIDCVKISNPGFLKQVNRVAK